MAKARSACFKGVPVLGELAAIADGHQLHAVPSDSCDCAAISKYKHKGQAVFSPTGDIMPHLEMLPWMVDLVDFIQKTVTHDGTVYEFMRQHELTIVAGRFWEVQSDELHSMCALRLGQTTIRAEVWLKAPPKDSSLPYVSQQLIQIGDNDARATYWVEDTADPADTAAIINRISRSFRNYEFWEDVDAGRDRAHEVFQRFKNGEELTKEDYDLLCRSACL